MNLIWQLKEYGLFFGPETSTSNRCNLGGMVGNNACGSHSLIYGSTRDHTIELKTLLSDGSEAVFGPVDSETFQNKCNLENLEGDIYRNIREILEDKQNRKVSGRATLILKFTGEIPAMPLICFLTLIFLMDHPTANSISAICLPDLKALWQ